MSQNLRLFFIVLLYVLNVGFFPFFKQPYGESSDSFIGENVVDVGNNDVLLNSTPFIPFSIDVSILVSIPNSSELLYSILSLSLESITSIGLLPTLSTLASIERGGSESDITGTSTDDIEGDEILYTGGVKFCNSGGNSVYTSDELTGLPIARFIFGTVFGNTPDDTP